MATRDLGFSDPIIDVTPTSPLVPYAPAPGARAPRADVPGQLTRAPRINEFPVEAVEEPVAKIGSPLNTLYGVDDESYLTDDQRKLSRMIQGKFDASMNRRDRELARYGAPRLSSFAEDESLARAMSLARGLNYRPPAEDALGLPNRRLIGNHDPGGGMRPLPRTPVDPTMQPNYPQTNAQWQRILGGLTSLIPLLFGKDAYGAFLNKGLLKWGKEQLFGPDGKTIPDEVFEHIVKSGGLPDAGGFAVNPLTGMPIGPTGAGGLGGGYDSYESGYQGGYSAGLPAPQDPMAWSDWNWGSGAGGWDVSSGGDMLDLFGGT